MEPLESGFLVKNEERGFFSKLSSEIVIKIRWINLYITLRLFGKKNTSVAGQVFGFEPLSAPSELTLCLEIYSVFSGVANLKLSTFGKSWRNSANWVC